LGRADGEASFRHDGGFLAVLDICLGVVCVGGGVVGEQHQGLHCMVAFALIVMTMSPNKSLQATGAAPSVLDDEGDSPLPGFVVASFPAPVPELGR
jgi:hypothetical protein